MMSETLNQLVGILQEQSKTIKSCEAPDTGLENRLEESALMLDIVVCKLSDLAMNVASWENMTLQNPIEGEISTIRIIRKVDGDIYTSPHMLD